MTTTDEAFDVVAVALLKLLGEKIGYGRLLELIHELQWRADEEASQTRMNTR